MGCSYCPVAVDIHGIVRFSESVAVVHYACVSILLVISKSDFAISYNTSSQSNE
jgi:hypothetical protein